MGDYFERIVDVEATGEEAGALAERMVDWMVAEGLITREMSDDGVYSHPVDKGYVPGPNWARALAEPPYPDWLPGPVAVVVGRGYYVAGQGVDSASFAVCPRCQSKTVVINYPEEFETDEEVWQPFEDAIAAWMETGEGSAPCASCGASVPVTEWQWSPEFALGTLAFDFWNWPSLSDSFCEKFSRQLGHRTVEHGGKV
ncbi:hypothetical protein DVA86_28685 [Streptomyces armeniacus]|uniref:Uncharacterized protein n=1 Tax=Streptomyces armeniacus TaxID=83291 RepID=A0A345XWH5_9ACTN|nr:hypothetical protein [Streptomyces armeniacus]AXK35991.1 hypothetical protein DVA86_28685 [Streptomyces armeniacus]